MKEHRNEIYAAATCRLQGMTGFEELEKVLRQELCLS
jgi:hypothetical protein